jgi:hypothetical protein
MAWWNSESFTLYIFYLVSFSNSKVKLHNVAYKQHAPWSRVPIGGRKSHQHMNKFPVILWNPKFITVFKNPAIGPYPEPDESNPNAHI